MARARKRPSSRHRARRSESSPRRAGPVGLGGRARDWAVRLVQVFDLRAFGRGPRWEVYHGRVVVGWGGGRAEGVGQVVAGGAKTFFGEFVGGV
jgi:hypothetical protein